MPTTAVRFLTLFFLVCALFAHAQQKKPLIAAVPSWVTKNSTPDPEARLIAEAEDGVLDLLYEKQISLFDESQFTKRAILFVSEAGIQSNSEVSVSFNPAHQQLLFHAITLVRAGRRINKLELGKMKTLQQETELHNYIYNGLYTTVLFLEDVQKDDVLEYSYTIRGFNPVFGGRYSGVLDASFSVPIGQVYYKIVAPQSRPLYLQHAGTSLVPEISNTENVKTYEWRFQNAQPVRAETNLPSWFDPYGQIQISEFKTWKEVSDWAISLFPFSDALSAKLNAKVTTLQQHYKTPETRVAAALRFVQDDVRYMGVEMGENSHRPHHPDKVLEQRFGDCKDKAYLLCTLLRAMKIDAAPVLINTEYRSGIKTWLPAPTAFDHATVRVILNGTTYWLDPTIAFQRGPLESISFPNFGAGLVVASTTTSLTPIPTSTKSSVSVKELFTIPDMAGKGKLKVVTEYRGAAADGVRNDFKTTSNFDLKKNYTRFYANYFNQIVGDSLTATDDDAVGVFTTTEYYTVDSIWGRFNYMKEASFEPYVINGFLKKTGTERRTMPYALDFPVQYTEDIEIELPEIWSVENSDHVTTSSSFTLSANYKCTGKKMVLHYQFKTLKDHVAPSDINRYNNEISHANSGVGYSLTSTVSESVPTHSGTGVSYPLLYLLLGICVFITYSLKKQNR